MTFRNVAGRGVEATLARKGDRITEEEVVGRYDDPVPDPLPDEESVALRARLAAVGSPAVEEAFNLLQTRLWDFGWLARSWERTARREGVGEATSEAGREAGQALEAALEALHALEDIVRAELTGEGGDSPRHR